MTVGRKRKLDADGLAALARRFQAAGVSPSKYFFLFVTPKDYSFTLPNDISLTNRRKWKFCQLPLRVTESNAKGEFQNHKDLHQVVVHCPINLGDKQIFCPTRA
ncbi:hypothetical protein GYMLUDRAFT_55898 [Collybiopsis luxurians FD-317 M1]|nr:hypothetical protein GYMLUDRAFT_55898 [Collybiopsis luxurians FD-317 M1]